MWIIVIAIVAVGIFYFLNMTKVSQQYQVQVPVSQTSTTSVNIQTQTTTNNTPVPSTKTNTSVNAVVPIKTPAAKTYSISIMNFAFNPNTLTINKGDTVIWTNNDTVPHQVKGDTLNALSAPVMTNGQTYTFTFNEVETFAYHCVIHPMMTANIIVK
jgi:plastocyanin